MSDADQAQTYSTTWDDLYSRGSYADAVGYATVLWPAFEEVEGMVFLTDVIAQSGGSEASLILRELDGDPSEVERRFNQVGLSTLIARPIGIDDHEDESKLAALLAKTWLAKLSVEYPNRSFVFDTWEDVWGTWISFHEAR
jgi:hypothetical protein